MPMIPADHESILNKLSDADLTHTERIDLLSQLRIDYSAVVTDFSSLTDQSTKLVEENTDLVKVNSKLFRQLGTNTNEPNKQQEEATFSETVSINKLLNGGN